MPRDTACVQCGFDGTGPYVEVIVPADSVAAKEKAVAAGRPAKKESVFWCPKCWIGSKR